MALTAFGETMKKALHWHVQWVLYEGIFISQNSYPTLTCPLSLS
jgi:hypothetical protein